MPASELPNALRINDRILTAGQPSEEQLREVAAEGVGAVINLGLLDPRYCLADEASLVQSLGMAYHHIPVPFDAPSVEHYRQFLRAMDDAASSPVLVHCAANYRVSSFLAVYGEQRLGWSREQADAHARTLWPLNDAWVGFLAECRAALPLDPA